jgi:hypothetical protein
MQDDKKTRLCPEDKHPAYTLQRYYISKRQAEMKCTACDHRYLRSMSDSEKFELRDETKTVLDVSACTQEARLS